MTEIISYFHWHLLLDGENIDSWRWFLACIRNRVTQWMGICVISYRHLGIMAAMSDPHLGWVAPSAYHRICMMVVEDMG